MQERLRPLLKNSSEGKLTLADHQELDEYERIEHYLVRNSV